MILQLIGFKDGLNTSVDADLFDLINVYNLSTSHAVDFTLTLQM